jgi:hypothetical protein
VSGAVLLCGDERKATRMCLDEEEHGVHGSRLHACLLGG